MASACHGQAARRRLSSKIRGDFRKSREKLHPRKSGAGLRHPSARQVVAAATAASWRTCKEVAVTGQAHRGRTAPTRLAVKLRRQSRCHHGRSEGPQVNCLDSPRRSARFATAMLCYAEHTMLEPIRRQLSPLTEGGDKG